MLSQYRISSNAIYPFRQNGKVCFLRLAPVEEKLEKNIFGELEFINYLLKQDYPALVPIKAKSGDACLQLRNSQGEYYVTAFKRVCGIQISRMDFSYEMMLEYGKALGQLHSLSSAYISRIRKWTHLEVLDWIESILQENEAQKYVFAELAAIKNELSKLPVNNVNYGLIHYDFEPDNVFYDKELKSCGVIDFDDGMYHWFEMDIVKTLDSLEEVFSGEELKSAKEGFLKGYEREHSLIEEMKAAQPIFRRFKALYSYARLLYCVADEINNEPDWIVDLRRNFKRMILRQADEYQRNWRDSLDYKNQEQDIADMLLPINIGNVF